jgi:hypothetical protein
MGIRLPKARASAPAFLFLSLSAGMLGRAPAARAEEPRKSSEPGVLREPSEFVQVVDAFDDDDLFDLHLSLGYEHTWKNAKIYRETSIAQGGLTSGGYTASNQNVASYSQKTSRLNTRADIGVYRDVAFVIRLPVILSDDRKLDASGGGLPGTVLAGYPGEQLFRLPFKSPTRSGIEYLALGLDIGVMSQARSRTKPTWTIGAEVRLNVSEPMHACNDNPLPLNQGTAAGDGPQVRCAERHDIDRDGRGSEPEFLDAQSGVQLDEGPNGSREPGVARGTTALAFHTRLSRRVKYIEPYGGFDVLFEFPHAYSDYGATDLRGSLVNHPPLRGTLTLGMAVIPWEIRDAFQRLTIDGRFSGTYVSEGRDYSELFDALGSSDARSLRTPQFADYHLDSAGRSVVDTTRSERAYFTGLTDVQQHGVYTFSVSATYQAGEYVKFNFGGSYMVAQGHFVTFDQACNPDFNDSVGASGPCHSGTTADPQSGTPETLVATGIPNPNYRKAINDPGRRFKVDDVNGFDAWINATVMF